MISGYVTFEELSLLTGYSEKLLELLTIRGLKFHEVSVLVRKKELKQKLINLKEFEEWVKLHIY